MGHPRHRRWHEGRPRGALCLGMVAECKDLNGHAAWQISNLKEMAEFVDKGKSIQGPDCQAKGHRPGPSSSSPLVSLVQPPPILGQSYSL